MNNAQKILVIGCLVILCAMVGIIMAVALQPAEQDFCNCVDSMPYMVTRMSEGKCLVSVFDPEAYHDASNLTVYQFLVMEHCR